jgi:hypothetical protein
METKFYHLIVLKSGDKFAVDIIYESKVYNLWGLTTTITKRRQTKTLD